MTAAALQVAVSWSSVAKNVGPPSVPSPQAGRARRGQAVSFFAFAPLPPSREGSEGARSWRVFISTGDAPVPKRKVKADDADDQPVDPQATGGAEGPQEGAGAAAIAAEAGGMHARLHHHAQEAEFGAAQSREGAPDQRLRGHRVYSGRRPQPSGALGGYDPGRPRQGPARSALPHPARRS